MAIGACTPPMVAAVKEVAGDDPVNRPRLIWETVLEPKLATRATPVASLMATPMGLVPTVTSGAAAAAAEWESTPYMDTPGSFAEVGRAFDEGLIDGGAYDAILDPSDEAPEAG